MKQEIKGRNGIQFSNPVYILGSASVVGTKEGQGPLGELFDVVGQDDLFGCNTWEEAESTLQREAVAIALQKVGIQQEEVSFCFAGDLLGQSIATSFGLETYHIPLFGIYGACSTCGEALALGAMAAAGGYGDYVLCVTSSHFASAEKEFRFPLEYGNQRPLSATWTVTGSGAFVLTGREKLESDKESDNSDKTEKCLKNRDFLAKITGVTIGKIVDFGLKDSMNLGVCMAPAAAETIARHFVDFDSQPSDYDQIITGDLGTVGRIALLDLLKERGYEIGDRHMDCGIEIYDAKEQDTHAGGSGCGCSAVTLSALILKKLREKEWQKVLFVPTGALLSKTSFNEGKSVPGIAHAIVLESV